MWVRSEMAISSQNCSNQLETAGREVSLPSGERGSCLSPLHLPTRRPSGQGHHLPGSPPYHNRWQMAKGDQREHKGGPDSNLKRVSNQWTAPDTTHPGRQEEPHWVSKLLKRLNCTFFPHRDPSAGRAARNNTHRGSSDLEGPARETSPSSDRGISWGLGLALQDQGLRPIRIAAGRDPSTQLGRRTQETGYCGPSQGATESQSCSRGRPCRSSRGKTALAGRAPTPGGARPSACAHL